MAEHQDNCPDCDESRSQRREFLKTSAAATAAVAMGTGLSIPAIAKETGTKKETPESVVKHLFESMTPGQKEVVCLDWEYKHPQRGLLRTHVANNWNITNKEVNSDFFNKDQKKMIRDIFEGIIDPEWHAKIDQQLDDDAGGFGESQSIAIFGKPGDGKFEFVMTGRHMTLRCDGNSADHVAFGGPIFYGHDPHGEFNEEKDHDGNVYWYQAKEANKIYQMLDGKQRELAEVGKTPREGDAGFKGKDGKRTGIPITELSKDQREQAQKVLQALIAPYRQSDKDEVIKCLKTQGGLDACNLSFYTDRDIGKDKVWDNWRLEGPSFVWHFRGAPHVHCWVNVADSADVKLNSPGPRRRG